jgi:hypothetical protein
MGDAVTIGATIWSCRDALAPVSVGAGLFGARKAAVPGLPPPPLQLAVARIAADRAIANAIRRMIVTSVC